MVDYLWRLWSPALSDGHHIERVKREALRAPGAIAAALGYYRSIFHGLGARHPTAARVVHGGAAGLTREGVAGVVP